MIIDPLELDALKTLARQKASEAIARLVALQRALPVTHEPARLREVARALPSSVAALGPEVCLAVHDVAAMLVAYDPVIPDDIDRLEPWLRARWLRVAIAAGKPGTLEPLDDPALHAIVAGWSATGVLDPRPLLDRLLGAADAGLRERGIQELRALVETLALTPAAAFERLVPLASDEVAATRARAIAMMTEGWLRALSPALAHKRERVLEQVLGDPDLGVARAAVRLGSALEREDWLRAMMGDPAVDDMLRPAVIDALGPRAQAEDLDRVIGLAATDPLRFGPVARRFLLEAHRHGGFVRAHHLRPLLDLFDAHPPWSAEELVRVTHIVRHELVELMAELAPDDPRWIRRTPVLAASVGTAAPRLIYEQLVRTTSLPVAEALVEAAGRCAEYEGEEPVLAWLDAIPEAVIPVLAVKGSDQAIVRLRGLLNSPRADSGLRREAMTSLWALCPDREALLRELSCELGPHESFLLDPAFREARDSRIARILSLAEWPERAHNVIEPRAKLQVLCESGDIAQRAAIEAVVREQIVEVVQRALAGDFVVKRVVLPQVEQLVFRYGRHLVAHGRIVRHHLDDQPQTGRDLVLDMVCRWLREDPEPERAVMVALLEIAGRHAPQGAALRTIEPLWRHRHREVRRAAIETILAAGEQARGLELSLARLVAGDDPRILVQALGAVKAFKASWAEPLVLSALSHPDMGVKKAAAEALTEIATERSVPVLVEWLAHHDNRGLRTSLGEALARSTGPTRAAVLINAIVGETEPRRVELLEDALRGAPTLEAIVRLARSDEPAHHRLVDACVAGRVTLAGASREALAAALHRLELRKPEPRADPGWQLRVEGFTPEAARVLVAARAPKREKAVLATVRAALTEWIAWLRASDLATEAGALALVLDAALPTHADHLEALLELSEMGRTLVDASSIAGMVQRCVAGPNVRRDQEVRAIDLLRALPTAANLSGLRRWQALERLHAVRGRDDLWRCLEECRLRPESATEALLQDALQIRARRDSEQPSVAELREQIRQFTSWPTDERATWLALQLRERPLGLPVIEPHASTPKSKFRPGSPADLESLVHSLAGSDSQARNQAAARLLDWPDAFAVGPAVLAAFLRGVLELSVEHRTRLARWLDAWPSDPREQAQAAKLLGACRPWQRRAFVRTWVARWEAGDVTVDPFLRATDESLLAPWVLERGEQGDTRLARLVRRSGSLAIRTIVERFGERAPADVAHLRPDPDADEARADRERPIDPIAGADFDGLVATIATKDVARGLAVRAVHALAEHGERASAPLERLVTDSRPPVRSAALRALRRVAGRDVCLEATARVLAMEDRRDVVISLMRSLGHGRHEPSLGLLIDRLAHRGLRVRQAAFDTVRAWGLAVVPALRRAIGRARPDRRAPLRDLIAELEQLEG